MSEWVKAPNIERVESRHVLKAFSEALEKYERDNELVYGVTPLELEHLVIGDLPRRCMAQLTSAFYEIASFLEDDAKALKE